MLMSIDQVGCAIHLSATDVFGTDQRLGGLLATAAVAKYLHQHKLRHRGPRCRALCNTFRERDTYKPLVRAWPGRSHDRSSRKTLEKTPAVAMETPDGSPTLHHRRALQWLAAVHPFNIGHTQSNQLCLVASALMPPSAS